jgi:hypothetical protein
MAAQYIKNPIRSGVAACWQGYAAREGFGITRSRYHIHAASPANIIAHWGHALLLMPCIFPVLGQRLNRFEKIILSPMGKGLILPLILAAVLERIFYAF